MNKLLLLIAVVLLGACNDNYHDANGNLKVKIAPATHDTIYVYDSVCYIHDTLWLVRYKNAHINHTDNVNIGGGYSLKIKTYKQ